MIEYGKENFYIGLPEKHPCSDKGKLVNKEGEYIRGLKPSMNLRGYVTCRNLYGRGYYHNNTTCRNKYGREYYRNSKSCLDKYSREYYRNNKEMVTCECGCVIDNRGLKQHIATKKHQHLLVQMIVCFLSKLLAHIYIYIYMCS